MGKTNRERAAKLVYKDFSEHIIYMIDMHIPESYLDLLEFLINKALDKVYAKGVKDGRKKER